MTCLGDLVSCIKAIVASIVVCFIWVYGLAQEGTWNWAESGGGINIEDPATIAVDSNGNSYITGSYQDTGVFGSYSLTNRGQQDVFVAKIDANGNYLWAAKAGGTYYDVGNDITIDSSGNVYITGVFNSPTIYFGNNNSMTLTRTGSSNDVFVAKLNSSGTWIWAKKAGGNYSDGGQSIALDSNNNILITGVFQGAQYFGSLPPFVGYGYSDIFVAKMDNNGNFLWASKAGGSNSENAKGIVVSSDNSIYICGSFASTTVTFGSLTVTNSATNNTMDAFVAKLDPNGNWIWVRKGDGASSESAYAITRDSNDFLYIAGTKQQNLAIGGTILESYGEFDVFVAKIDTSGNWIWAQRAGGPNYDIAWGIAVDSWSNLFVTGEFKATAVFGPYSVSASPPVSSDIFMAKLSAKDGTWLDVERSGNSHNDVGKSVAVGPNATSYWYGNFQGEISFGSLQIDSSNNSQDVFIAKKTHTPVLLLSPNGGEAWLANTQHQITWSCANISNVRLDYKVNSDTTWIPINSNNISASLGTYNWTLPNLNSNQVLVRVRSAINNNVFDVSDSCFSVTAATSNPQANFTANPISGIAPLTVNFTDTSTTPSGTLVAWNWTFGDGGTSSLHNPQHVYQNAGQYSVSLTVTNSFSASATLTKTNYITVTAGTPGLNLLSNDHLEFGSINVGSQSAYQAVIIKNIGTAPLILTSTHFTGTQSQFQLQTPYQTVIQPGNSSNLNVRFSPSSVGSLGDILYINNNSSNDPVLEIYLHGTGLFVYSSPQADFSIDISTGLTPLSVNFTDQSTPGSGTISSWHWTFGDGSVSNIQNPSHTYSNPGTYPVTLTVINSYSLSNTLCINECVTTTNPMVNLDLVSGNYIDCGSVYVGEISDFRPVVLHNSGNADLFITNVYFSGNSQNFQYYASDESFLLNPGETDSIFVSFGPLYEGDIEDRLFILNDSQNVPTLDIQVAGTGLFSQPLTPENLEIYADQYNMYLYWDPVTQNEAGYPVSVDYYVIYCNSTNNLDQGFTYSAFTTGTNYIQYNLAAQPSHMYFRVVAVDLYGGELRGYLRETTDQFLIQNLSSGMSEKKVHEVLDSARKYLEMAG